MMYEKKPLNYYHFKCIYVWSSFISFTYCSFYYVTDCKYYKKTKIKKYILHNMYLYVSICTLYYKVFNRSMIKKTPCIYIYIYVW